MQGMLDVQAFVWGDAGGEHFALLAQHDVALACCEHAGALCGCAGCQLVRAVQLRARALGGEALVVLAHFVREEAALRLHNAEAVCWAGGGKGWPLSAHEHAALSRSIGARVAALAPMTLRGAGDVFEAQGINCEVAIGRHHGRCVGAGVGRAWAFSTACTDAATDDVPVLDAHDEFEGGMSHIREHKTCFVVRSWCCLEFKCGGRSELVHLPLHITTQHPESEGRLVTQCWYNAAKRAWSAKVRKEYGSKLRVRRVLKLETADAAGRVQSALGECTWARQALRTVYTTWGSQWPREYAGMVAKSAAVGAAGWLRCTERVSAARAPALSGVLSREQICTLACLLQPDAAVRVLDFFHARSMARADVDALCYSVLLGYSPCLALVADAAVDVLLCSMRCAAGGATSHDWELRQQRARELSAWHAALLQASSVGGLAPLNEWSHVARAGLVPAVLLHYGAVLTVRGPLPLACQPGPRRCASARKHAARKLRHALKHTQAEAHTPFKTAHGNIFLDPRTLSERELHAELRARGFAELSAEHARNFETLKGDMCADPFSQCSAAWEELRQLRYALTNPCAASSECKRVFLLFAATCKQHARAGYGSHAMLVDWVPHADIWGAALEFLHSDAPPPGQLRETVGCKRDRIDSSTDAQPTPVYIPPCAV